MGVGAESDRHARRPQRRASVEIRQLVRIVPEDGVLVANADDARVGEVAREANCPVVRVSLKDSSADFSARDVTSGPERTELTLVETGLPAGRYRWQLGDSAAHCRP